MRISCESHQWLLQSLLVFSLCYQHCCQRQRPVFILSALFVPSCDAQRLIKDIQSADCIKNLSSKWARVTCKSGVSSPTVWHLMQVHWVQEGEETEGAEFYIFSHVSQLDFFVQWFSLRSVFFWLSHLGSQIFLLPEQDAHSPQWFCCPCHVYRTCLALVILDIHCKEANGFGWI